MLSCRFLGCATPLQYRSWWLWTTWATPGTAGSRLWWARTGPSLSWWSEAWRCPTPGSTSVRSPGGTTPPAARESTWMLSVSLEQTVLLLQPLNGINIHLEFTKYVSERKFLIRPDITSNNSRHQDNNRRGGAGYLRQYRLLTGPHLQGLHSRHQPQLSHLAPGGQGGSCGW